MGSYFRDGSDYMPCRKCGEKFDLNDPERRTIHEGDGGRFQPFCSRCLRQKLDEKYGGRQEVACVACGECRSLDSMGLVDHVHPNGEVDPVFVCSADCTANQLRCSHVWWDGPDRGESTADPEASERARAVADSAVEYISTNYRCAATLLPRLIDMQTFEFTVRIDRPYQPTDETFVERFDRVGFETEFGRCTLLLEDYAAFGICKFGFELVDE